MVVKSETLTVGGEPGRAFAGPQPGPVLVIAAHPDRARIGDRLSLEPGQEQTIGRREPEFGPAPLADGKISSAHVTVAVSGDRLSVVDQGSKNGLVVAGPRGDASRVPRATLDVGAFFQIGATVLRYLIEPPFPLRRDAELAGISHAMHELREAIAATGKHDRPVLVVGATGVGKEVVARAIHRESGRSGPFVALNCATLSRDLAEAELFGYVKGAFTGAERDRPGLFRSAEGGSLFLDEIGTLPLELQPKLLRVLQERTVRPVGASREEKVDVRVVAATNERLAEKVAAGAFRDDLYSRLLGGRLSVSSLDARREDIVLLGLTLLARAGHADVRFSEALAWRLLHNPWPLNVRALEQTLLSAAPLAQSGVLDLTAATTELLDEQASLDRRPDTPAGEVDSAGAPREPDDVARPYTRKPTREDFVAQLARAEGNVARVAEAYGVRRQQIYRWAEALGVDLSDHR